MDAKYQQTFESFYFTALSSIKTHAHGRGIPYAKDGKLSTFSFGLTPIQVVVDVQPPENSTDTAAWNGVCFIAQNDCGSFIGSLTPDEREVKSNGF